MHAEAMLLVDDHQSESPELDFLLEQRVRANRDLRFTRREIRQRSSSRGGSAFAGDQRGIQLERRQPGREIASMLLGEQLSRRHHCNLKTRFHSS